MNAINDNIADLPMDPSREDALKALDEAADEHRRIEAVDVHVLMRKYTGEDAIDIVEGLILELGLVVVGEDAM